MKDRYLITGATGFIGSCLTRKLVELGHRVSILTRGKKLNWRLDDITSKITIYEFDLLDSGLETIIAMIQPSVVYHLASYGSLPNEQNVDRMVDVNIKGLLNLIQAVKKIPIKLFINTGSSSEYGVKDTPMRETDLLEPNNDYGVSKASATLFCKEMASKNQLPIVTFRLFSPYGYREHKTRFVPYVIAKALTDSSMELSFPDYVRDFIFIEDVLDALLKAPKMVIPSGSVINIGSGKQHKLQDVVDIVMRLTRSRSKIHWNTKEKQERQAEPRRWEADISLAQSLLRWSPRHSLEQGLEKTIEWIRRNMQYYN